MTTTAGAIAAIEHGLAEVVAGLKRLRHEDDWVDQYGSPLGKRAHLEAVRRGDLVGRKVGKSVLVRRSELDSYIEKHRLRVTPKVDAVEEAVEERRAIEEAAAFVAPRRRRRGTP